MRLKQFAKEKYGSISALAEATGIIQPQISSYTSGQKKPSVEVLLKILMAGCNINWLLSGEGDMMYSVDYKKIPKRKEVVVKSPSETELKNKKPSLGEVSPLSSDEIMRLRSLLQETTLKKKIG